MSDQAVEGTQAAPAQETGGAADMSAVLDRVGEIGQQVTDLASRFDQEPQDYGYDPYGQQDYGQQEPGYLYGQPQQDPYGQQQYDPQQGFDPNMGQDQALGMLNQLIGNAVNQATAPLMQRLDQQELDRHQASIEQQRTALQEKYPELAGETGQQFTQKASEQAKALAGLIAPTIDPSAAPRDQQAIAEDLAGLLANGPGFLELVYLASKAEQDAQQETPAGASQEFELEPGGGAAQQAQPGSEADQYLGMGGEGARRTLGEILG